MSNHTSSNVDAWTDFWATGSLHSCAGSYDGGYGGAIANFWVQITQSIGPSDRILDIATGNGPLPRLLFDRFGASSPEIHAIDRAEIRPNWYKPDSMGSIHFHSGMDATALPFADASFDWIISQFGFEYVPFPASVQESARVLKPGGRLALVLHHSDSVISRVGLDEADQYQLLLAEGGLFDAASVLLPHLVLAAHSREGGGAAAEAARKAYNEAMAALGVRIDGRGGDAALLVEVRDGVHQLMAMAIRIGAQRAGQLLVEYRRRLVLGLARTRDMLAHRLGPDDVRGLAEALSAATDASAWDVAVLHQAEGIMAWGLTLQPKAPQ